MSGILSHHGMLGNVRYLGSVGSSSPAFNHHLRIHYRRPDDDFLGWTVYCFGDTAENLAAYYAGPLLPSGKDDFGIFFDARIPAAGQRLGFVIHNPAGEHGDAKDPGPDMFVDIGQFTDVWVISGDSVVYTTNPLSAPFSTLQTYWISSQTVAVPEHAFNPSWSWALVYSPDARIAHCPEECSDFPLTLAAPLTEAQLAQFPTLRGYMALQLPALPGEKIASVLKCQLAVVARDQPNSVRYITGVQIAGILDELFAYEGILGATFSPSSIDLSLWAPTAQSVSLLLFREAAALDPAQSIDMTESRSVWSASIDPKYKGCWYQFAVTVYAPGVQQVVRNEVSDPYSLDLALNGIKSRLMDPNDPGTKPRGWDQHISPHLESFADLSIYELHVRDFSVADETVREEHRGTYLAFADQAANGMRHLRKLADAGLKAIHLLPTFHFASVDEDKTKWKNPGDLTGYAPDSEEQQAAVTRVKDEDGYNWGYDPVHYMAPSGAYAANPDDRVKEYRGMVQALHQTGVRVIQDVVFNHTAGSGQTRSSVLDKIVPAYYHRLDDQGRVYNSTCCPNTASEHKMMGKLMVDALVSHARHYKVDGFRFDLMNFHTVDHLLAIRQALAGLTLEKDGVDGSKIYLYGEGWSFGELLAAFPKRAATQNNIYGSGIGTFNDRVRDAVRGGSPFSDQRVPGFATGLKEPQELGRRTDWIKLALAGNLRDYRFTSEFGESVTGEQIDYLGQSAGYAAAPIETINYCSVHDNQCLFDAVQLKSPASEDAATRARRQVLAMSIIALGQGIPFFFGGDDLLRSKDMDHNSYNSGDWFNKIDWTYRSNGWGIGLPIARENEQHWPEHRELLKDPNRKPGPTEIEFTRLWFEQLLRIRYSSPLFRLRTAEQSQRQVWFLPAEPGSIVMHLKAAGQTGERFQDVVVFFNGKSEPAQIRNDALSGLRLELHPEQKQSHDKSVREGASFEADGTLRAPALTTAVFVSRS